MKHAGFDSEETESQCNAFRISGSSLWPSRAEVFLPRILAGQKGRLGMVARLDGIGVTLGFHTWTLKCLLPTADTCGLCGNMQQRICRNQS